MRQWADSFHEADGEYEQETDLSWCFKTLGKYVQVTIIQEEESTNISTNGFAETGGQVCRELGNGVHRYGGKEALASHLARAEFAEWGWVRRNYIG